MKNDVILLVAMFVVAWIGFKLVNEHILRPATGDTSVAIADVPLGQTMSDSGDAMPENSTVNESDPEEGGPKGQIKSMIRNRVDAWNTRNLMRFMDDYRNFDSLTVNFLGVETGGWQNVYDYISSEYQSDMGTLQLNDIKVDVIDSKAAIVVAQWSLTRSDNVSNGRMSLVLNKIESTWKIIAESFSKREM